MSGKKMVLLVVLPILVLAGGVAALYVTGVFDRLLHPAPEVVDESLPVVFYHLPQLMVNLTSPDRRQFLLRVTTTLELDRKEDVDPVAQGVPRVLDNSQLY